MPALSVGGGFLQSAKSALAQEKSSLSSYSSSMTVEAFDSKRNVVRTLTLRGGGLPKMGASWGVDSQMSTTFYPGNPDDGTQQFTVAKEMPSEWSGEWNLTRLNRAPCSYQDSQGGSAPNVVSPGVLIDVFEDMQRKGQLLRVTWTVASSDPTIARTVLRVGRIAKFTARYTRSTDVEWEATFAWKSRGGVLGRVASTRAGSADAASASIVAASASLNALATQGALFSSNPAINLSASSFSLGALEQLVAAPQALLQGFTNSIGRIVGQIGQVVGIIAAVKAMPASLAATVVGFARNTIDQANQFADQLSGTPSEQLTLSNNVADLAVATSYYGSVHDQSVATSEAAQTTLAAMMLAVARPSNAGATSGASTSTATPGTLLAVWRTVEGDTPQSVSRRFFGTVDQDAAILYANNLPLYQPSFDPGTLLVIPAAGTIVVGQ